ncbi:YqaJ viral recombinase family protein [Kitasatospora sp. HPMI-4]|uniref:YqaJ viral recombinase family nuclease n=1 Tax=Kitasatospora sp. HPMI-4 TaxID=3448443 RepID=UPI003F1D120E
MSYLYPSGAQVILPPGATPDDPAWHAARRDGLGGSDMAAICGLDKYTSPLEIWHTKTGSTVPRRDDPVLSEAALMGHLLEPVVAQRFSDITGLPVYDGGGTIKALDPAWALANVDRVTQENGEYGVLELKTRSSYALDEWLTEPPTGPWLQVQHYLMVTGWRYGHIACLIGGQRTIVHRVERDDDLIDGLRTIGAEFWQQVQDGTPPPVTGSAACTDLINRLHPTPTIEQVTADAAEVGALLRQRAAALAELAAPTAAIDEAENRLRAIAGDATEVHVRGELAYSWPQYSRRGAINWRQLASDYPTVDLDAYRGPDTTYRVLRIPQETL